MLLIPWNYRRLRRRLAGSGRRNEQALYAAPRLPWGGLRGIGCQTREPGRHRDLKSVAAHHIGVLGKHNVTDEPDRLLRNVVNARVADRLTRGRVDDDVAVRL